MSDLTTQMLRTLEPQDLAALLPAPVKIGDRTGMVLRLADTDLVELFHAGTITFVSTNVLRVEPITDPVLLEETLRNAVEALTICRRISIEAHAEQRQRHAEKLEAIRQYAINAMERGVICQQDLNAFLVEFGFERYSYRAKIAFTITGSYEVYTSTEAAMRNAVDCLGPDVMDLDELDDQTVRFHLDLSAEPL